MAETKGAFFVGWGKVPKDLRVFLASCAFAFIAGFALLSYAVSSTQSDPGNGAFLGRATAIGVLRADPYPVLHVIKSDQYARGTAILLTGGGKRGVFKRAAGLDRQVIRISGVMLQRGDLNGVQLRQGKKGLRRVDEGRDGFHIQTQALGKWKLTGEICDGKCLNGAMRPGRGLAHKACANLCLIGAVPPVFVLPLPVEGSSFLLMANADGEPLTKEILDFTATYVEIEGEIERQGELLVFKIAPDTLRLAE